MPPRHLVTLLVLLALAVASAPTPAHAGGVVSICDEAHLLAALVGGGTVSFGCSGTITLTATITIAADTSIDGSGQTVTISGNNTVRVFTVNSGAMLNLNRLTVASGRAESGGGIYNSGGLNVSNCTFSDNGARFGDGGGIYNSGALTVSNSTFSGNSVNPGGSGGIYSGGGGGIYNHLGTLTVISSTFSGNSVSSGGSGGAYSGCGGGGIYNHLGTLTVSNSIFSSNSIINDGGGIRNESGTVAVSNSTFVKNGGMAEGGGIANVGSGTLIVSNSTFSGNSVFGPGGGIGNFSVNSLMVVSNSTFSDNRSAMSGGGIHNSGTAKIGNCTFARNSALLQGYPDGNGGGIDNYGTLIVSNSTFSDNSSLEGGGISNHNGAVTTLKNTIVANNPEGGNCSGTITDGGGNLSYPDATCPGLNSDPVLGPLQNNGGPTPTMALLPSSAAIDAGDDAICAAPPVNNRDQRGSVRPQGAHCDIGAYEALPSNIVSVCDEAHLLAALVGSGTVTFSCSGKIILKATITIAADTTIDSSRQSVTISGNNAVRVFTVNPGVTVTLNALTITDGSAADGGGIYNSGTLKVNNSTFDGNIARSSYPGPNFGGGIYNNTGALTVSNTTFSSNGAYDGGGGIYNNKGALTVSNTTFYGNGAARGGGIYNSGTLTVSNTTFSGNSAYGGGSGIYNHDSGGAVTTLRNTIVANSPAGANCSGTIADGSGNLTYPDTTCPGINFIPALGPLQNNGGPTKTMALLAGSTAIDRANDIICAAAPVNNLDQRGVVRPQGLHCDIGAYEATPPRAYLPIILR